MRLQNLFVSYTVSGSSLSVPLALVFVAFSWVIGTFGYFVLEGYSLVDAFYMNIITFSTVGYGEIMPLSEKGRIFTSFLIIMNIGIFAYSISAFSTYIIQGEFFKRMHLNWIKEKIDKLDNHIILCGYGKYGREIIDYFFSHGLPFVVIDRDLEKIKSIQTNDEKILYIEGDATDDDVLLAAGIKRARVVVCALPDDTDNVFTVLTARQLNAEAKIISRASLTKSEGKLKLAGANHVIMPDKIGGFYIATLVNKPGAVEFFSFLSNEYESDIYFEEIRFEDAVICQHKSIRELNIRKATNTNIIGYRTANGRYVVNPSPDTVLEPGSSFILLGNEEQISKLKEFLRGE